MTKPFDTDELLARLRTSLRRRVQESAESQIVKAWDVEIDLVNRLVRKGGEEIHLTPKEYAFLSELAKHPGRVFTHKQLLGGLGRGVRAEYRICPDRRAQPAPEAGG